MRTDPETEMLGPVPEDVEPVGVGEDRRITVGGADARPDGVPLLDLDAADFAVLRCRPGPLLRKDEIVRCGPVIFANRSFRPFEQWLLRASRQRQRDRKNAERLHETILPTRWRHGNAKKHRTSSENLHT